MNTQCIQCILYTIHIYIYGAAVINLRSKITYGPQMLRSVFLRFPLFIHSLPPLLMVECSAGRRRTRGLTHLYTLQGRDRDGEGYKYIHYTYSGDGGGGRPAGKPTIFLPGKKRRGSKTMRTPPLPSLLQPPPRIQDQLHRPGRMVCPHWSGTRTVTPGPHLPHRRHPLHVATRDTAAARGLLMFLGRRRRVHAHILYYQKRRRRRILRTPAIYYYEGFPKTVFSNSLSVIRSFSSYHPPSQQCGHRTDVQLYYLRK